MYQRKMVFLALALLSLSLMTYTTFAQSSTDFVVDVYHTQNVGCGTDIVSNQDKHGGERCTEVQYTCLKKDSIQSGNKLLIDVQVRNLQNEGVCPSGYVQDAATVHGPNFGNDPIALCRKYATLSNDGKFKDDGGKVITKFIEDAKLVIGNLRYFSLYDTSCPAGYERTSITSHSGNECLSPHIMCVKYAVADSLCRITSLKINTTGCSPTGCAPGNKIRLSATYTECPAKVRLVTNGVDAENSCEYSMNVNLSGSGSSSLWTVEGPISSECAGKTITFNSAYLLNATEETRISNTLSTTNNDIIFTSDLTPPSINIAMQPSSPSPAENPRGIYFMASSQDYSDVKNITIFVGGVPLYSCTSRFEFPCYGISAIKYSEDIPVEYYAVAYDITGNRAESEHKFFEINSGRVLSTQIMKVGDDTDSPYYISTQNILVDVSGRLTGDNAFIPDIRCRWDANDLGYKDMRTNCQTFSSGISTCVIPDGGHCTDKGDGSGRKMCSAYIACSDSREFYNQSIDRNLNVRWIFGSDIDPPEILLIRPSNDESVTTSTVRLNATTDELSECRWSTQPGSYSQMPIANSMNDAGGKKNHTVQLSNVPAGENTYYIACRDTVKPTANEMQSATSTKFFVLRAASLAISANPSQVSANGQETSRITVVVKDPRGADLLGDYTISFSTNRGTLSTLSCRTNGGSSCAVDISSQAEGLAIVTATLGTLSNRININFTHFVTRMINLSANPSVARPGQNIIVTAVVKDTDKRVQSGPFTIRFILDDYTKATIDPSCNIRSGETSCTVTLSSTSPVALTISANSDGIEDGSITARFANIECGNKVCELPYETRSTCNSDCASDYSLITTVSTLATSDMYGIKFTSNMNPRFSEPTNYYICDGDSSYTECLASTCGIGKQCICKNTEITSEYTCNIGCANSQDDYYALVENTFSKVKVAGNIGRFSCPSLSGADEFEGWVVEFTSIVNSYIPGGLSFVRSIINTPGISDEQKNTYKQLEANLLEAKDITEAHLSYLLSVKQKPTQATITDANSKSQQVYDKYRQLVNPSYVPIRLETESIRVPSVVLNNSQIDVSLGIRNPTASSSESRYVFAACRFLDPSGSFYFNASRSCTNIPVGSKKDLIASMHVGKLGKWNVTYCSINVSQFPDCSLSFEQLRITKDAGGKDISFDVKMTLTNESTFCGDSVCDDNENTGSCPADCPIDSIFTCSGRNCDATTDRGVAFSSQISGFSYIDFVVCNREADKNTCYNAFRSNNTGIGKFAFCGSTLNSSCFLTCSNDNGQYYMLAKSPLDDRTSRNYSFVCPEINLDDLINNRTQFNSDVGMYKETRDNNLGPEINSARTRGRLDVVSRLQPCYDAHTNVINNLTSHISYLDGIIAAPSIGSVSKALDESRKIDTFVNKTLNEYCGAVGLLLINSTEISPIVVLGENVNIRIAISSVGNITYYGVAGCEVVSPSGKPSSVKSSCDLIDAGSLSLVDMNFKADEPGIWNVNTCSVYASFNSVCGSTVHDTVNGGKVNVTLPFDDKPPVTSIICNEGSCSDVYTSSVRVNLSCTDTETGCKETFYCVDRENSCNASTRYAGAFSVSGSGVNYARYLSVDLAGNKERVKSRSIEISNAVCGDNLCESSEVSGCSNDCPTSFSSLNYEETERGVRFKASLSSPWAGARIIACNATASYGECRSAYELNNCGIGKKCLCGWFSFDNSGCEIRCGDMTSESYGISYQPVSSQGKTIKSQRITFACPEMNRNIILNYLREFEDYYTLTTNELQNTANVPGAENYRAVLEEVRLISLDQKGYLESVLLDLTISKSREAIKNSQEKEIEINSLLSRIGNFEREIEIIDVVTGESARLGKDIKVRISNNEDFWRYGSVTCRFQRPDSNTVDSRSDCAELPPRADTDVSSNITLNILGNWSVQSCSLKIAVSKSCNPSIPYGSYDRQKNFIVREPLKLSINASVPYDSVSFGNKASIHVETKNEEDVQRYAFARCSLRTFDNARISAKSDCVNMGPNSETILTPSFIADTVGDWFVESCSVEESNSSACTNSVVDATQFSIGSISVIFDRTLSINSASLLSSQFEVGDTVPLSVSVRNGGENSSSAFVNCTLTDPNGNTIFADAPVQGLVPGGIATFRPSSSLNMEGSWVLNSCTAYRIIGFVNNEHSTTINKEFYVAAAPQCVTSNQCGNVATSCECSSSICVPCSYGYDCMSGRCLESESSCVGTTSSCYNDGNSCVACSGGSLCIKNQCVSTGESPLPSVPLFLIILISLAVITPIAAFIIYRMVVK